MKLSTLLKNLLNERMQEKIREKAEFLDSSDIFSAQIRLKKYLETNQDKEFKCHGMFYDFKNFGGARNHIVMNLCCQISLENGEEEFINSIAPFTGKQTDRMVGAERKSPKEKFIERMIDLEQLVPILKRSEIDANVIAKITFFDQPNEKSETTSLTLDKFSQKECLGIFDIVCDKHKYVSLNVETVVETPFDSERNIVYHAVVEL